MLKTILITSTLILSTIPSYAQQVTPLCYLKTSDGAVLSLDYLCMGQNQVTPQRNPGLQINNVSSRQRMEFGKFITVVTGSIMNTSNKSVDYVNLNYSTYRKNSEGLTEQESDKEFTKRLTLRPGESSTFEVKLTKSFDVFLVNYLDSVQIQNVDVKSCYASGLESSNYCNLLSPISIQRFK